MTHLYLIRHGRPSAVWGADDPDPGLDEIGSGQAQAAARALMALDPRSRPRAVVSSPLRRCRETAQPLADGLGLGVEIDPAVGEIPTPAGLDVQARPAWLRSAIVGLWRDIPGDLDYDVWRKSVFAAVKARPGAAVFSHFVAINAVLSVLAGEDRVIGFRPDHAAITTLDVTQGQFTLVELGRAAQTTVL